MSKEHACSCSTSQNSVWAFNLGKTLIQGQPKSLLKYSIEWASAGYPRRQCSAPLWCECMHLSCSQWKVLDFHDEKSSKDTALLKLCVNSLYYLEQKYLSFTQNGTGSQRHRPPPSQAHGNPTDQNHLLQQGTKSTSQPLFLHIIIAVTKWVYEMSPTAKRKRLTRIFA